MGRDGKVSIYWENRRNNIKTLPPMHTSPNWYQHPGSARFPEVCRNSSQLSAADPELTPRRVGLVFSSSQRGFVLGSLRDEVAHTFSSLSTQLPNYLELPARSWLDTGGSPAGGCTPATPRSSSRSQHGCTGRTRGIRLPRRFKQGAEMVGTSTHACR